MGRLRLHLTTWRTLRRFRLTYKKKTLHAGERDTPEVQAKRRRYRAKVRRIEAKRLVFVDETGVNTAMTPTHAWARRGERAKGSVPSSWGSTTVIAALGLDGVRAPLVFPGATDTQAFQTYVDQVLVPELRPGDVVVFDNLKPHLSRHVAESIERAGGTVLPLPPYSSDYDPIEELWSKFKGQLRRIAARTKDGLYKAVGETLDSVTIQDILGWFNHSGRTQLMGKPRSSKMAIGNGHRAGESANATTSRARYSLRATGSTWPRYPLAAALQPIAAQVSTTALVSSLVQVASFPASAAAWSGLPTSGRSRMRKRWLRQRWVRFSGVISSFRRPRLHRPEESPEVIKRL